jgi:hypothetical protein
LGRLEVANWKYLCLSPRHVKLMMATPARKNALIKNTLICSVIVNKFAKLSDMIKLEEKLLMVSLHFKENDHTWYHKALRLL